MMKRRDIYIAFCFIVLCFLFLCGCGSGGQSGTIIIGSEENGKNEKEDGLKEGEDIASESRPDEAAAEEQTVIRVYVCGAVVNPGVVSVPAGSRAEDALVAAGGFREDAGREAVNLADWIEDGQMLYFPTIQEAREQAEIRENAALGLVNINTADAAQLCALPGIGESRAADIIDYREKNGDFKNCEDIMQVPGIKTSVYEKICDKITVK